MQENKQLLEPFLENAPDSDKDKVNNAGDQKQAFNFSYDQSGTSGGSALSQNSSDSDDEMHIYDLPKVDHTKAVMRKLLTVSVVCFILMCAEITGGYLASSLAIMTDAAHLFSDLSGFFISVFSLFLSRKAASNHLSFGYHRAEVIGALASVILIWGLTIWLCYEATMRLLFRNFQIDGLIMLVTSCFALLANLVMGKILHSSGHSHSHGGQSCGGHGHAENKKNKDVKELKDKKEEKKDHGHSHKEGKCHGHGKSDKKEKIQKPIDQQKEQQPQEQKKPEHGHSHKNGKTCHGHSHKKESKSININKEFDDEKAKPSAQIQITMQEFQQKDKEDEHDSDKNKQQQQQQQEQQQQSIDIGQQQQQVQQEQKKEKKDGSHHGHSHAHAEKKKKQLDDAFVEKGYEGERDSRQSKDFDSDSETGATRERNLSQIEEKDNPNLRAAMIHIIGDTLQSIGVIIAAVIIYSFEHKYKNIKLADPICTFVFAILVIFTTIGVTKDCIRVLMEGTPTGFHLEDFKKKLKKCAGVVEVHDLHLWQLSVGKPSLSCHIVSNDTIKSLKQTTRLCRKYGIYHSTIQVEDKVESEKENFIKCHQNIHLNDQHSN